MRVSLVEFQSYADRAGISSSYRRNTAIFECAKTSGGKIARNAVDACRVGAVGRQVDLDDGRVQMRPLRIASADRRVGWQFNDAVVIIRQFKFSG